MFCMHIKNLFYCAAAEIFFFIQMVVDFGNTFSTRNILSIDHLDFFKVFHPGRQVWLQCNGNTWEAGLDHLLLRHFILQQRLHADVTVVWRHLWPLTHLMKLATLDTRFSCLCSGCCVSESGLPSTDGSNSGSDRFICSPKQSCHHQPPDRWHQNPISVV